jgi:hypothetical protein
MSMAWETSIDDILIVMKKMGHQGTEEQARTVLHDIIDHDLVEAAALCGTDMDDQVSYAHAEIEEQIKKHIESET